MTPKERDFKKDLFKMDIRKYLIDKSGKWTEDNILEEFRPTFREYYREAFNRFYSKTKVNKRKKNSTKTYLDSMKLEYNNTHNINDDKMSTKVDLFLEKAYKND